MHSVIVSLAYGNFLLTIIEVICTE